MYVGWYKLRCQQKVGLKRVCEDETSRLVDKEEATCVERRACEEDFVDSFVKKASLESVL